MYIKTFLQYKNIYFYDNYFFICVGILQNFVCLFYATFLIHSFYKIIKKKDKETKLFNIYFVISLCLTYNIEVIIIIILKGTYPKFYIHPLSFVGLKTLATFIKFLLVD